MFVPLLVYLAVLWIIRPVSSSYGRLVAQKPMNYYPQAYYANPPTYYTTAKPYYPSTKPYLTTAKPYHTTMRPYYTTPAPYSTTAATYYTTPPAYYTTEKPSYTTAAPYYTSTAIYYTTPEAYYPATYPTGQQPYVQPSYTTQSTHYQPSGTTPDYYPEKNEGEGDGWHDYAFKFNVNDFYGNEQSRRETHENKLTSGQYTVNLPDGRKQIVTYEADENGYRADVSYEPAEYSNSDTSNYYSTSPYESNNYYQTTKSYNSAY